MGQQREPCQARRRVCAHTAAALGLCHQAVLVPRYVRVSQCVSCARAARVEVTVPHVQECRVYGCGGSYSCSGL